MPFRAPFSNHSGGKLLQMSSAPTQDNRTPEPNTPTRTILLAEDNDQLRTVMECTFALMGYRVLACADAQIAAAAFHTHPEIDLLFTDFEMPGRNGVELARELTLAQPSLPVLIYTGANLTSDVLHEIEGRNWTYVAKPCQMPDLESKLQKALPLPLPSAA